MELLVGPSSCLICIRSSSAARCAAAVVDFAKYPGLSAVSKASAAAGYGIVVTLPVIITPTDDPKRLSFEIGCSDYSCPRLVYCDLPDL